MGFSASCGASIVGEEKFKKRKDGGKNRHVYYHCSRQVKYDCTEKYVKEKDIVEGLIKISDQLITDLSSLEPGLQKAIDRYENMTRIYNPGSDKSEVISNYIKYVLINGTDFEKTRLVRNINVKLVLKGKKIAQD